VLSTAGRQGCTEKATKGSMQRVQVRRTYRLFSVATMTDYHYSTSDWCLSEYMLEICIRLNVINQIN